jgi:DNA-binding NarL/FixJ family response regulator
MKVFLVDNGPLVRKRIRMTIEELGGRVMGEANNQADALRHIAEVSADLLILDLNLAEGSGLEVLRRAKTLHPDMRVFVLTNYSSEQYWGKCVALGADFFFDKTKDYPLFTYALELLASSEIREANHEE